MRKLSLEPSSSPGAPGRKPGTFPRAQVCILKVGWSFLLVRGVCAFSPSGRDGIRASTPLRFFVGGDVLVLVLTLPFGCACVLVVHSVFVSMSGTPTISNVTARAPC